jgi:hypothetical protein
MLNIKKKTEKKFEKKKFFHPHPQLHHVSPLVFIETLPNSFKLVPTTSKLIGQNFKSIGRTNAEKKRDMTQTTDTTNI